MFNLASSTAVLLLAVASSSAHSIQLRRHHNVLAARGKYTPPQGWATGYLEPYDTYHERYVNISCQDYHNTSFFDKCCHPLLATETLAKNRPACCTPGNTASCLPSHAATTTATPTATSTATGSSSDEDEDEGEDCDDENQEDSGSSGNTDVDSSDGDDEDCEDEGDDDESSSTVIASTSAHPITTSTTHTTVKAAPTTTTTKAAPTTTTTKAAPTTTTTHTTAKTSTASTSTKTSSSSSTNQFITGGHSTWFTQNGVAGNCGKVHQDTDLIVALPTKAYQNGAHCGQSVLIIDTSTGKSETAIVADSCPSCDNDECLDMSTGLFEKFASLSVGVFPIKYQFLD